MRIPAEILMDAREAARHRRRRYKPPVKHIEAVLEKECRLGHLRIGAYIEPGERRAFHKPTLAAQADAVGGSIASHMNACGAAAARLEHRWLLSYGHAVHRAEAVLARLRQPQRRLGMGVGEQRWERHVLVQQEVVARDHHESDLLWHHGHHS